MHTCSTILCLRIFSLSMILMATLAPVSTCFAYLTLAKVPSPKVFPISYLPIRVRTAWWVLIFFLADLPPPSPSLSLPPFVSFQIKVANLPPQPSPPSLPSPSPSSSLSLPRFVTFHIKVASLGLWALWSSKAWTIIQTYCGEYIKHFPSFIKRGFAWFLELASTSSPDSLQNHHLQGSLHSLTRFFRDSNAHTYTCILSRSTKARNQRSPKLPPLTISASSSILFLVLSSSSAPVGRNSRSRCHICLYPQTPIKLQIWTKKISVDSEISGRE